MPLKKSGRSALLMAHDVKASGENLGHCQWGLANALHLTKHHFTPMLQVQVLESALGDEKATHSWNLQDHCLVCLGSPLSRHLWAVKHVSGFCAIGRNMLHQGKWTHHQCPHCGQDKDSRHVLQCRAWPHTPAVWNLALAKLSHWMVTTHTLPGIQENVIINLWQWRTSSFLGLQTSIFKQHSIGWDSLLEGFVSQQWIKTQQAYYILGVWLNCHCTGKHWAISLVQKLWNVSWDLWADCNGWLHHQGQATNSDLAYTVQTQFLLGGRVCQSQTVMGSKGLSTSSWIVFTEFNKLG